MYFTNVDYMIFTEENSANKSTEMIKERKRLQNKMLRACVHSRFKREKA